MDARLPDGIGAHVLECLTQLNARVSRRLDASRRALFEELDAGGRRRRGKRTSRTYLYST